MVFTAKWRLTDVENVEAYHNAIHTPEEFKAKLRLIFAEIKTNPEAYIEEMTVDKAAGKIQRVVYIKGEKKRDSGLVSLNHEVEHTAPDGRKIKAKAVLESDEKLVIHEEGPDFKATVVVTLHGDELKVTQTADGVTCVEKYHRV